MADAPLPQNRVRRSKKNNYRAFKALKAMRCFPEVDELLRKGFPATQIALMIHDRWEELEHLAQSTIVGALRDYRRTIPEDELFHGLISKAHRDVFAEKLEEFDATLELEWLWKQQRRRLEMEFQTETSFKKLLSNTAKEIKVGVDILKAYSSIRMDLGLDQRNLGEIVVTGSGVSTEKIADMYGEQAARVSADPEKVNRCIQTADRLMGLLMGGAEVDLLEGVIDVTPDAPEFSGEDDGID